jgi:glycine/D-amino acid oxidase-like deaminating enzyme
MNSLLHIELPCNDSFDVIVVGGGPSGCTAAAAAAREGARTLLIEASGCLGGSGTSALVPAWCPFSDKEKIIYRGLAEKVFTRAKEGMAHVKSDALDWVPIDAERLKRVYDDLVTEAGVTVLFQTMLSHVARDASGRVTSIATTNKSGLSLWSAKVFVDCTGDADLVAWAGGEFHKGDAEGKRLMPATHCFLLANVDEEAYKNGPWLGPKNPKSPIFEILRSGKYPLITDAHCCHNLVGPGTVGFNAGHLFEVDNTDPASVSSALMLGRKMAAQFRDALAEYHPAFAHAFLVATGSQVGIRETRRIVGDYILTLEDYLARRSFPDEICRNSYFIDIHWAKEEVAKDPEQHKQWEKSCVHYGAGESHGIPYRCLTPAGLKNVLVAGRSVSCEQVVQGSIRVMPVCLAMGEAAGLAAALAARSAEKDVHAVDTDHLRQRLREENAYLPDYPTA